jgi:hypothetical protein
MSPNVTDKAREVIAKVRPGSAEGRRSLPIRSTEDQIRRVWDDAVTRAAILDEIPVAEARIEFGDEVAGWGRVTTVDLKLKAAVPGMATQTLAGKAVRRLKAMAETGEVPTTKGNPSGREANA